MSSSLVGYKRRNNIAYFVAKPEGDYSERAYNTKMFD
jgi:hypothetical protein